MTTEAIPVERGCGSRVAGGVYWELGIGPGGSPVEDFLLDAPVRLPAGLKVPARGVMVFEQDGVTHLIDRVGLKHYPYVADFVEEVRRFGLSRRLSRNLPFARLTPASRLLLVHDLAWVEPTADFQAWHCPKGNEEHAPGALGAGCCAGVWWQDVGPAPGGKREIIRELPAFSYGARATPPGLEVERAPAFFMSVPASRFVVVRGGSDDAATVQAARAAGVSVEEVDL